MYTAMALVALTVGSLSGTPAWQKDYKAAQTLVSVTGKPMAVFVGNGTTGYEAAVRDGFDPAVSKLLAEKFVCLYVDTATEKGKALAAAFQVGNRGVVLSDREGKGQVYSASGTITRDELNRALITYQDVQVAQKTDAPKTAAPAPAPAPGGAVLAPGQGAPGAMMAGPGGPMMAPAPYYGGGYAMGGYGGGCGNCGGGCGGSGCGSGCGWGGGCGMSKGCCFFGGCNKGYGCGTPCAAPAPCNTGCGGGGYSKGCCFLGGLCGFGHGGGCGGGGCGGWGGGCGGGWGGGCCH